MNSLQITVFSLLASLVSVQAATILNETFADGNRTGQNPPSSLNWLYSGTSPASAFSSGTWTITSAGAVSVVGYFTDSGSPLSLSIGETLTLSFNVSHSANYSSTAGNFRYGVFDSGASRLAADTSSSSDTAFETDRGYGMYYSLNTAENTNLGTRLRDRVNDQTSLWTASAYTTMGADGNNNILTAGDTSYAVSLTMQYVSATEMIVSSNFAGNTPTRPDTTPQTTFDMISFYVGSSVGSVSLSNVQISVVPEPSTAGACLLAGAGLALISRQRRRR